MRKKVLFGFLLVACTLALAPVASAEPDGERTPAIDAINQTDIQHQEPSVSGPAMTAQIHAPTIVGKAKYAPGPAIIETEKITDDIAIAATDPGPPWAFTHRSSTGPCKDVILKRDAYMLGISGHHSPGPCTT